MKRKNQSSSTNKFLKKKQYGGSTYVDRPKLADRPLTLEETENLYNTENPYNSKLIDIYARDKYPEIRNINKNSFANIAIPNISGEGVDIHLDSDTGYKLMSEIPHADQYRKQSVLQTGVNLTKDIIDSAVNNKTFNLRSAQKKTYTTKGTQENDAHRGSTHKKINNDYQNFILELIEGDLNKGELNKILGRKQFGGTSQNILAEDGELYLDENGEIQEVNSFSHDDSFVELPNGQKAITSKGNGGQILDDAVSVLSDSYTQVKEGERKNTAKEEQVAIKSKDAKKLFDYKWFNAGKNKKYSPSELVKEVIEQRDKKLSRYSDAQKQDSLSLSTNQLNASLMPSDEDIYNTVLGEQEDSKGSEFEETAQYGGSTYVDRRPVRPSINYNEISQDSINDPEVYRSLTGDKRPMFSDLEKQRERLNDYSREQASRYYEEGDYFTIKDSKYNKRNNQRVNKALVNDIISASIRSGVDPYTALSIAQRESGIGHYSDKNLGVVDFNQTPKAIFSNWHSDNLGLNKEEMQRSIDLSTGNSFIKPNSLQKATQYVDNATQYPFASEMMTIKEKGVKGYNPGDKDYSNKVAREREILFSDENKGFRDYVDGRVKAYKKQYGGEIRQADDEKWYDGIKRKALDTPIGRDFQKYYPTNSDKLSAATALGSLVTTGGVSAVLTGINTAVDLYNIDDENNQADLGANAISFIGRKPQHKVIGKVVGGIADLVNPKEEKKKKQYGGVPVNPNGLYEEDGPVIIPSGDITMEGIDYPVDAYDADTNEYLTRMQPNMNYKFKNSRNILEIPVIKAQTGYDDISRTPDRRIKINGTGRTLNPEPYKPDHYVDQYGDVWKLEPNGEYTKTNLRHQETIKPQPASYSEYMTGEDDKYEVRRGDWISSVAPMFGLTEDELLDLNPDIKETGKILPGQRINVMRPPSNSTPPFVPILEPEDRSAEIDDIQELPEEVDTQAEDVIPTLDVKAETVPSQGVTQEQSKEIADKIRLGKIDRTQGTNALREMMRANRSINLPYRAETPRRLFNYNEEDATPYLDEIDGQINQALQNVNQNTAQGQAIAANILNRAGQSKRQIINRVNQANLQRRQQIDNANVSLQNQFDMMQEQNNKNYVDETYQTLANYDRNKVQQAEYLDDMINNNTKLNNFFLLENMRNPNYQIDPVTGEIFRIGTPFKQDKKKAQYGIKRKK